MNPGAAAFVRAFVAVEIPEEVRGRLGEVQARLKESGAHVGWVRTTNLHFSLAFLGNIAGEMVEELNPLLDAAACVSPFSFSVADLGTFGSPHSPRVVWAGVRDGEPLVALQGRVAEAVRAAGLKLEDRPFKPHLTLGRVRSSRGREDLVKAIETVGPVDFGRVDVAAVFLMKSELKPSGAEYTVLHRSDLA